MKKIIGFVTAGLEFDGNTLTEKSLGGSESAMIYMARELAKLGNTVYVYCPCKESIIIDGVCYAELAQFMQGQNLRMDVLIMSRHVQLTPNIDISNMTVFWMHDVFTEAYASNVHMMDKTFLMSNYQKSLWVDKNKHYSDVINVTKNGYDADLVSAITHIPFEQKKNNYIYASRPERGLVYLIDNIWPEVLKLNPDAVLHVTTYENKIAESSPIGKFYTAINKLVSETKNVIQHTSLLKKEYYELLSNCAYMLYPTDFPEISCINAIEAQALGCVVISTDKYALSETVKSNTLVTEEYGTDEYNAAFLKTVESMMSEPVWEKESTDAYNAVKNAYSWATIAGEWNTYFNEFFEKRYAENKDKIIQRLKYNSDYVTVSQVDPTFDKEILPKILRNNLSYDYLPIADLETANSLPPNSRHEAMLQIIASYIEKKSNLTILELGCNDGIISGNLYKAVPTYIDAVIAFDGSADALAAYKKIWQKNPQCSNIEYITDDVLNLSKYDLKADIIIVGEILEHIVDYKKTLIDIQRCANPGALVIFSTPAGPWSWVSLRTEGKAFSDDYHLHNFELNDLDTIFSEYKEKGEYFIYNIAGIRNHQNVPCDNYIFGYINNAVFEFNEYDPLLKAKKTRPYQSLSVCMIVKNEERHLYRCLHSVKEIADEIIIVDTGSTDHTKEIALQFTDQVYDYKWEEADGLGHFGSARNFSVSKATGDWILYIDADEELRNSQFIGTAMNSGNIQDYLILQKQLSDGTNVGNLDQHPNRLYRNNGVLRFFDAIHECPRINPYEGNDVLEMTLDRVQLLHFGYLDSGISYNKITRNHQLIMKNMKLFPGKIEDHVYFMRSMMYYYQLTHDPQHLYAAVGMWAKYPISSRYNNFEVSFWNLAFDLTQTARKELQRIGKETYVVVKDGDTEKYYIDETEHNIISKLLSE